MYEKIIQWGKHTQSKCIIEKKIKASEHDFYFLINFLLIF